MNISEYQRLILKSRDNHVKITDETIKKLNESFERAYERIEQMLFKLDSDTRKTAQRKFWKAKKDQLLNIADELANGFSEELRNGMNLSALQTVNINKMAEEMMLAGTDIAISDQFPLIPLQAVNSVWKRIGSDGLMLSNRIWDLRKHIHKRIDAIVMSGIARGQSAVNMAKDIQFDILGIGSFEDIPESQRWTTRISKAVRARGTIHYNALRLARTEIGNAYHEADIMSAMASKILAGIRWNLSPAHGQYDICDTLASIDLYGLGSGVYPPENVPLYPHPNDMCYTTRELLPKSDWGKTRPKLTPKKNIKFEHPETTTFLDSTRKKQIERKVTTNYKKRIEKQFWSMMNNIVGSKRFKGID